MPNAAQIQTYEYIRSQIALLRGPRSYVPLSLERVSPLADDGDRALFYMNGARVFIEQSGNVVDRGCPIVPAMPAACFREASFCRQSQRTCSCQGTLARPLWLIIHIHLNRLSHICNTVPPLEKRLHLASTSNRGLK